MSIPEAPRDLNHQLRFLYHQMPSQTISTGEAEIEMAQYGPEHFAQRFINEEERRSGSRHKQAVLMKLTELLSHAQITRPFGDCIFTEFNMSYDFGVPKPPQTLPPFFDTLLDHSNPDSGGIFDNSLSPTIESNCYRQKSRDALKLKDMSDRISREYGPEAINKASEIIQSSGPSEKPAQTPRFDISAFMAEWRREYIERNGDEP